jgi:hypothetical protein
VGLFAGSSYNAFSTTFGGNMDESLYLSLRTKLRERATKDDQNQQFLMRFARAIEGRVNQIAGREQQVCTAGSMHGTTFVRHEYDVSGSTIDFTLQIEFHNAEGNVIFTAHVPFTSKCHADSFIVKCISTGESVEQLRSAASTEATQLSVINLLDKALVEIVEDVLRN